MDDQSDTECYALNMHRSQNFRRNKWLGQSEKGSFRGIWYEHVDHAGRIWFTLLEEMSESVDVG